MIRPNSAPFAAALAAAILVLPAFPALAEKADKDKPTHIEANRMSSDDNKHLSIFEGSVVLTKGTVVVHADRIVVHQDAEGFQFATATGKPVRFRQKGDPKGDKEGVWTDGEALHGESSTTARKASNCSSRRASRGTRTWSTATTSSSTSARSFSR